MRRRAAVDGHAIDSPARLAAVLEILLPRMRDGDFWLGWIVSRFVADAHLPEYSVAYATV